MYVLDTNTVSYYLKGQGRVAERLLAASPAEMALPSVVVYELTYGAGRSQAPRRVRHGLESLLRAVRVLPFGDAEARTAARVRLGLERAGVPIGPLDLLVAARSPRAFSTAYLSRLSGRTAAIEAKNSSISGLRAAARPA